MMTRSIDDELSNDRGSHRLLQFNFSAQNPAAVISRWKTKKLVIIAISITLKYRWKKSYERERERSRETSNHTWNFNETCFSCFIPIYLQIKILISVWCDCQCRGRESLALEDPKQSFFTIFFLKVKKRSESSKFSKLCVWFIFEINLKNSQYETESRCNITSIFFALLDTVIYGKDVVRDSLLAFPK